MSIMLTYGFHSYRDKLIFCCTRIITKNVKRIQKKIENKLDLLLYLYKMFREGKVPVDFRAIFFHKRSTPVDFREKNQISRTKNVNSNLYIVKVVHLSNYFIQVLYFKKKSKKGQVYFKLKVRFISEKKNYFKQRVEYISNKKL